jgi:flagellar M-ring protein FliF
VESFLGSIRQFGVGRLAAMLGVGAGVVAVLVALVMFMGKEPNELLYSNLDLKEASQVTQALAQAGIKYETKGDGSTIMVPRDKVASARLMVAGKGLVSSGSIGYEIFDSNNALGQTDFVQQLNRQRALQGELERTIKAMQGVNAVRVHLVLPSASCSRRTPNSLPPPSPSASAAASRRRTWCARSRTSSPPRFRT